MDDHSAPGLAPRAIPVSAGRCQRLPQVVFRVRGAGEALHDAADLNAQLLVEERRREAERVEQELVAASGPGFLLRRGEEALPVASSPQVLADPEPLDLAGSAPGPPEKAGHDLARIVADEDRQPLAVVGTGLLDVVVVEAVFEEADVLRRRLDFDLELLHVHGRYPARSSISDSSITCPDRAI